MVLSLQDKVNVGLIMLLAVANERCLECFLAFTFLNSASDLVEVLEVSFALLDGRYETRLINAIANGVVSSNCSQVDLET